MPIERQAFLQSYVDAMHEGHAALFIGAGISRSAGFVDWKGLMRECALEVNLDLEREHDLVAVAQYYLNRRRDRSRLNQILRDEFDRTGEFTKSHQVIARLPVTTLWTTNFDSLLEDSFRAVARNVDVKSRDRDVALPKRGREIVLYKMHGDIARPDELVISKDDYEVYSARHPVFQHALEADLISKTFLFLGFSFTDPNLEYTLGHLRTLLAESKHEHYAVMRAVRESWHPRSAESKRAYQYERNKQDLQIEDLKRYGIQTLLVERYEEVPQLLEAIEQAYCRRSVFVSGSANQFGALGEDRMRDLCMRLGESLIERNFRVICGMGLNIGDAVVKGALLALYQRGRSAFEKHLILRPFPRHLPNGMNPEDFNARYRGDMIGKSGFAVFIAGTSRTAEESVGVLQEYEIAKRLRKIPIPIGATGYAAQRIWNDIRPNLREVYGGKVSAKLFGKLNDVNADNASLVGAVFDVIKCVADN